MAGTTWLVGRTSLLRTALETPDMQDSSAAFTAHWTHTSQQAASSGVPGSPAAREARHELSLRARMPVLEVAHRQLREHRLHAIQLTAGLAAKAVLCRPRASRSTICPGEYQQEIRSSLSDAAAATAPASAGACTPVSKPRLQSCFTDLSGSMCRHPLCLRDGTANATQAIL